MKEAILSSDTEAVVKLQARITELEKLQRVMKSVNRGMRLARKAGPQAQVKAMADAMVREGMEQDKATARAMELLKPDYAGRVGFPAYELTNNNANIRRLYERIEQIQTLQATPMSEIQGSKARFEDAPGDNRVRLFFPGKPDAATRSRLKHAGFRWAPSLGCWQAYRNYSSLRVAKQEAGLDPAVNEPVVSHAEALAAGTAEIERTVEGETAGVTFDGEPSFADARR